MKTKVRILNQIFLSSLLLHVSQISFSADPMKYQAGDCILAIDRSYTWYGEYTKVEAVMTASKEYSGRNYILWFPTYKSNDVIFSQSIELATKKVDANHCKLGE